MGSNACALVVAFLATAFLAGCVDGSASNDGAGDPYEQTTPPHQDPTTTSPRATGTTPPTSPSPSPTSSPSPSPSSSSSPSASPTPTTTEPSPTSTTSPEPTSAPNPDGPPWPEPHDITQAVWISWGQYDFDVLVLGVKDPVVGAAIQKGIALWTAGITALDPELGAKLTIRVHWAPDGVPPFGLNPDIVFVPQGFYAISTYPCLVNAPMLAGWGDMWQVAAHEFGHCLGLGHVFGHGVEYEPSEDVMGGSTVGVPKCPSNLNVEILRMSWAGDTGELGMPESYYFQAPHC